MIKSKNKIIIDIELISIIWVLILFLFPDMSTVASLIGYDITSIFVFITLTLAIIKFTIILYKKINFSKNNCFYFLGISILLFLECLGKTKDFHFYYDLKLLVNYLLLIFLLYDNRYLKRYSFPFISFLLLGFFNILWFILYVFIGKEILATGTTLVIPTISSFIILGFFNIKYTFNNKKKVIFSLGIINTIGVIFWLLEAKSRTTFIVTLISIFLALIQTQNNNFNKKSWQLIKMVLIPIIGISLFLILSQVNLGRLISNDTTTLSLRYFSITKNLDVIKNNMFFGNGLGTKLWMYRHDTFIPEYTGRTDNLYITLSAKIGIIGLISIILPTVRRIFLKFFRKGYYHLFCVMILFFISTTVLTAQLIYSYSITVVYILLAYTKEID